MKINGVIKTQHKERRSDVVKIFGRKYVIDQRLASELIKGLEILSDNVTKDVILCYSGLDTIDFDCDNQRTFFSSDVVTILYDKYKHDSEHIRDTLLRISVEDTQWTKKRNAEYNGVFYRKIVLNDDAQALIKELCSQYIEDINRIKENIVSEEETKQAAAAYRQSLFSFGCIHKEVSPSEREAGSDGYFDVDVIRVKDGAVFRYVQRDVFDVGCYCYPKRLEGTPECLEHASFSDDEKAVAEWLSEFGRFRGIRM